MADDQRNPWQVPQGDSTPANAEASDSNNLNQDNNDNQGQPAAADQQPAADQSVDQANQVDQPATDQPATQLTAEQPTETIPTAPAVTPDQPTTPLPAVPTEASDPNAGTATPGPYRPSPEYGAYNASQSNGQPMYGQNIPSGPFNPYPFGAPEPEQPKNDQSNNGQQQNQSGFFGFGNPFGAQNNQNPQNNAQGQSNTQPQQSNGQVPPQVPPTPFAQGPQPQQPGQQTAQTNGKSSATTIVTAVISAVLAAALMLGLGWAGISYGWITVPTSSSINSLSSSTGGSGSATAKSGEAPDWKTVASDVSASVVSITTQLTNGTGKGSGAIIDKDGHIVTNNHVVSGAQQIQVTLSNGNLYSAQLVGTDTTTDLAVIKLDNAPSDLTAVTFADSDTLAVGEDVMAVGNPLGYANTVTTGIVSALNRPVTVQDEDSGENIFTNAVQIDAAINPGNSGGPTFNAAGQVIGINSSIASTATSSSSAGSIGIGFAIPSNLVKRVTDEIVKNGKVQHVALGVTVSMSTATATADGVTRAGSGVTAVTSGGPAEKAGVKSGDVIVGYNGKSVTNSYSLLGFVRASAMGDTAKLTVVRDGKTIELTVTLDQEESAVNGSSSSNNSQNQNNQNNNGSNGNGSNGNGSNGQTNPYGNSGNGSGNGSNGNGSNGYGNNNGDNGGLSDPFSQLFGWN